MSVYYSQLIDNVERNGKAPYEKITLFVRNQCPQQSNLLVRLTANDAVFAQHLHRLTPAGLPNCEVQLSDIRLIAGTIVIQLYTTISGQHPLDIILRVYNRRGHIIHEWGMVSFTEFTN
ncbi:hypothetical protein NQ117_21105 [Paenibacillus sp. SC116]|uniref:hypothetical protein n=1 Tax=Paenibacillus sp. SC116 TaxID=2968986 RepID=UPI00215AF71A|nr:hypothetical protein [Paenibacillus sp. SC116]MCR8846186.1 hypothetical protein [Paenibacillus sp. SC116]